MATIEVKGLKGHKKSKEQGFDELKDLKLDQRKLFFFKVRLDSLNRFGCVNWRKRIP